MSVFAAHKASTDNDIFSIDVSSWLGSLGVDLANSAVNVVDRSTPPVNMNATMYAGGSLVVNAAGVATFFLKGGTPGQTYDVNIDLQTDGGSPRTKRFRLALTVVD